MARKKPQSYNKHLDNLTVDDLLNLSPDELSRLSQKDMQRIVRTASLAANKRVKRLMENAKRQGGSYVPKKSAKQNIATDALNYLVDENKARTGSKKGKIEKFGVGDKDSKQELQKELSRIRRFMKMKTSTIKGAKQVRKTREKNATGKTREDVIRTGKSKNMSKKDIQQMLKNYDAGISDVYKQFREYIEAYHPESKNKKWEKYTPFQGSDEVLAEIRFRVASGHQADEDELEQLNTIENEAYEQEKIQEQEEEANWIYDDEDDEGFTYFT